MKTHCLFSFFLVLVTSWSVGAKTIPHWDLEMQSSELLQLQKNRSLFLAENRRPKESPALSPVYRLGERNSEWLNWINQHRDTPLSFSNQKVSTGIPITSPSTYNEAIILERFRKLVLELPENMRKVLIGGKALTNQPPGEEQEYLEWGWKIEKLYQLAIRWDMLAQYMGYLEAAEGRDVRGFYFLSRLSDRQEKLTKFSEQSQESQNEIRLWLTQMCYNQSESSLNGEIRRRCQAEVSRSIETNQLNQFYSKYEKGAQRNYESFFNLAVKRKDLRWETKPSEVTFVPFLDPRDSKVQNFLLNIEKEWQWLGWFLKLDWRSSGEIPFVRFESNVTPHVNRLGGNEIVMNKEQPLTEWDVQWTIRHEFGHVLGFPDCYLEFYDRSQSAIVSYQIDIENLMCSRKGRLQEIHFLEMKKNYRPQSEGL